MNKHLSKSRILWVVAAMSVSLSAAMAVEMEDAALKVSHLVPVIPGNDLASNFVSVAEFHTEGEVSADNAFIVTEYFDGLGRSLRKVSPSPADGLSVVSGVVDYDAMGRPVKEYLPFHVASDAAASCSAAGMLASQHGGEGNFGFASMDYPGRLYGGKTVRKNPGSARHKSSGTISDTYIYKEGTLRLYHLSPGGSLVAGGSWYGAGELEAVDVTDEDGHRVTRVSDRRGVQIRTITYPSQGTECVTDFLYNIKGELECILTPVAYDILASYPVGTVPAEWRGKVAASAYFFTYDEYGRMLTQTTPGAGQQQYVYDAYDRLIFSSDGNLREEGKWRWYAYDERVRRLAEGIVKTSDNHNTLIHKYKKQKYDAYINPNKEGNFGGYVVANLPGDASWVTKAVYYDTYEFLEAWPEHADSLSYRAVPEFDNALFKEVADWGGEIANGGRVAGVAVWDMDGRAPEVTASYYDASGRVVQTRTANHMGGYTMSYMRLRLDGKPLRMMRTHSAWFNPTNLRPPFNTPDRHTDLYEYTYDRAGNLSLETVSHDGASPVIVSKSSYDNLGRLSLRRHGNSQKVGQSYRYTMSGALQWLGGSEFVEQLYYEKRRDGSVGCLNGSISGSEWRTWENTGLSRRYYDYRYDLAGRLLSARYTDTSDEGSRGAVTFANTPDYSTSYTYDKLGNLLTVYRKGLKDRQTLEDGSQQWAFDFVNRQGYEYDGVRLKSLAPISRFPEEGLVALNSAVTLPLEPQYPLKSLAFEHDANGNLTFSPSPSFTSLTYDADNRLRSVRCERSQTTAASNPGEGHIYGADGALRRSVFYTGEEPVWFDSGDFNTSSAGTSLGGGISGPISFPLPVTTYYYSGDYRYEYNTLSRKTKVTFLRPEGYFDADGWHFYLRDHLGSVRVVVSEKGAVEEFHHYYPYGEEMAESSYSSVSSPRFNGKEGNAHMGSSLLDYGARTHLPVNGRFLSPDPSALNRPGESPYLYCGSDPVNRIDPDGRDYVVLVDMSNGTITVKATYYTLAPYLKSLQKGIDYWNKLSYKFKINGMAIRFDLKAEVLELPKDRTFNQFINPIIEFDLTGTANSYSLGKINSERKHGGTEKGHFVRVSDSHYSGTTPAHEIGHTLGLVHSDMGLMTTESSSAYRSWTIYSAQIERMLYTASKGEPDKEKKGDDVLDAGQGTVQINPMGNLDLETWVHYILKHPGIK